MTASDFRAFYLGLDESSRIRFLARLAANLTIDARGTYEPETENVANAPRLRAFNELQHRVLGHLRALVEGDSQRYDEDTVVSLLEEAGNELQCQWSFTRAMTDARQTPPSTSQAKRAV